MSDDWYVASVDEVIGAADRLSASLGTLVEVLATARSERVAGGSVLEVVNGLLEQGGREQRLGPTVAFRDFERVMTAYRARAIRALVDEEGLTFSAVARLTGVSRQMVARLYRAAEAGGG